MARDFKALPTYNGTPLLAQTTGFAYPSLTGAVRTVADAAITTGTATLTSATGAFTAADVGKKIAVWGAGTSGATLATTISSVTNSTTVVLATNASTTVSAKRAYFGTDNTTAIQAAVDSLYALGGGICQLPVGHYMGSAILKPGVTIRGVGMGNVQAFGTVDSPDAGTILQTPPDATHACIASGSQVTLDPFHTGVMDLTVFGGAMPDLGQASTLLEGPAVRGIELSSPSSDAFQAPVAHSPNDPAPVLRNVGIVGVSGDVALYVGTNMRGAYVSNLSVYRCHNVGVSVAGTDTQFVNLQVGVCAVGVSVTGNNNLFSNSKAWWCGDTTIQSGLGYGWFLQGRDCVVSGCSSQDNFAYGLVIKSNASGGYSNTVTGFQSGGDTTGAVLLQSDGTHLVSWNRIDFSIVDADRTSSADNAGLVVDGAGGDLVYENAVTLTLPNYFSAIGGSYVNYKLLNSGTMNRNVLDIPASRGYGDDGAQASGTYNPFFTAAGTRRIQLTGNITIGTVSSATGIGQMPPGSTVTFIIDQDGTGNHTVTWDASWVNAPVVTPTASSRTIVSFHNISNTATPSWTRSPSPVPPGGASGGVLLKKSATDFDTGWSTAGAAVGQVFYQSAGGPAWSNPYEYTGPKLNELLAWSFDPYAAATSGTTPATGTVYLSKILVPYTMSVTNVVVYVTLAGSSLTSGQNFVGLCKSDGTLIGASADQTTAWTTGGAGAKTAALASGPFTVAGGPGVFVWGMILAVGTTTPTFIKASASGLGASAFTNIGTAAATTRFGTQGTSKTALATITPGSIVGDTRMFWMGLS